MRVLWTLLALLSVPVGVAFAQDPVEVDSQHYSVIFENDQVRVLRIRYGPNEESVMHAHPAGVAIYMQDLNGQFTLPDGEVINNQGKAGDAVWAEAGSHLPKNLSAQPFEVILVELKEQAHGAPSE